MCMRGFSWESDSMKKVRNSGEYYIIQIDFCFWHLEYIHHPKEVHYVVYCDIYSYNVRERGQLRIRLHEKSKKFRGILFCSKWINVIYQRKNIEDGLQMKKIMTHQNIQNHNFNLSMWLPHYEKCKITVWNGTLSLPMNWYNSTSSGFFHHFSHSGV